MPNTHTPGPWYEKPTAGYETHGQSAVYSDNGDSVALVYEGEANARLIAQAPRMLDLLIEATEDDSSPVYHSRGCELRHSRTGDGKCNCGLTEWCERARAILRAVKGE